MTSDINQTFSVFLLNASSKQRGPVLSAQGFQIIGSSFAFLSIIGFLTNGCVLLIFIVNKTLRSPTNLFIMALSICDILMTACSGIACAASFQQGWVFGDTVCTIEGFSVYFLGLTSMYLLAAISLDRYVVIVKPLTGARITKRVAIGGILLCWTFGFFWASLPLVGWNHYTTEGLNISCSVVWHSTDMTTFSYIVTIFIFCLLLPLCLMVFSYLNIYLTVRSMGKNSLWSMNSRMSRKQQRLERKMLKTSFTLVAVFIVSWSPYTVVSFMSAFGKSELISPLMATIPALAAKCSGLWNPFVYVATNAQFRKAFYDLIRCSKVDPLENKYDCKTENSMDKESKKCYSALDNTMGNSNTCLLVGSTATPAANDVDVGRASSDVYPNKTIENGKTNIETMEMANMKPRNTYDSSSSD